MNLARERTPRYGNQARQIVAGFVAAASREAAVRGLLLLFGGKLLIAYLNVPPSAPEISTLLIQSWREQGLLDLGLSFMLYFVYRDPMRNTAIIYAVILILFCGGIIPLLSHDSLHGSSWTKALWIWVHSFLRVAAAALIYYLRPRGESSNRDD